MSVFNADPSMLESWSELTGQPVDRLHHATMARFSGAIPELEMLVRGDKRIPEVARMTWFWTSTTQVCPQCMTRGPRSWLLEWRLPWIFDCPVHNCLLLTHCPSCGRLLQEGHPCFELPSTLTKDLPGLQPGTPVTPGSIHTAQAIRSALAGTPAAVAGGPVPAQQFLRAVRALSGLLEHLERAADLALRAAPRRAVAAAPRSSATRADRLTEAHHLLRVTPEHAAAELSPRLARVHLDGQGTRTWLRDHTRSTELLAPIVDELVDSRRTIGRKRIQQPTFDPAHVPQMMHAEPWNRLRPHIGTSENTGRCFASVALVKMSTGMTWRAAADALALPPQISERVGRQGKRFMRDEARFTQILREAAIASVIDWRKRERQAQVLLDDEGAVRQLAHAIDRPHLQTCFLREQVWTLWASGHPQVALQRWATTRAERANASNQRRRWRTHDTTRLLDRLNSRHQTQS